MQPNDEQLTSTYHATVDAGVAATYGAFQAIDPIASLARRLSALGVDDRAVWVEAPAAVGPAGAGDERELGFSLLWRFGPPGQTARIDWRLRLGEDAAARTALSILLSARGSNRDAGERLMTCWPMVETLALAHARGLCRAVDEYTDDPSKTAPRTLAGLHAVA